MQNNNINDDSGNNNNNDDNNNNNSDSHNNNNSNNMTQSRSHMTKTHSNILKNLSFLKKRSFDVKFDLEGTGYSAVEKIGIGAYGVVCSAVQSRTGDKVAIKKIPNVFDHWVVTKRTYREIKILKHFKHDNIISIRDILKPKEGPVDFRDIYVVLDLMESDLRQIIYSKQPLTEEHIRYFLYQILRGLKYIHSANVVHRDLKPNNLLVRENCHLRIGDFGMARGIHSSLFDGTNNFLTHYVATRWYRAPEIMFSLLEYGSAMDMWSVGCIFAEMLGRKHLFPGKDYIKQAQLIIEILGSPSEKFLSACQSDLIKKFLIQLGNKKPVPWSTLYPKASRKALDLLSKLLVLVPSDRFTVEQALRHPYLSVYHDSDDEPICVPAFNFDFEKQDMSIDQFRKAIYEEIIEYHASENPTMTFNPVLRPAPKTSEPQTILSQTANVPSNFGSSVEVTEQGAALQAFVKQLRERVKTSTLERQHQIPDRDVIPLHLLPDHSSQNASHTSVAATTTTTTPANNNNNNNHASNTTATTTTTTSVNNLESVSNQKQNVHGGVDCVEQNLLTIPNSHDLDDIEMLSAKSSDSKMESTSHQLLAASSKEKQQEPVVDKQEHQTISTDTRELIKAALRNSNLKKRNDVEVKDDNRPRPVTAAQRQREREDKRRKRKERALKRMKDKKVQDAEAEDLLSDADRELLERWKNMQTQKTGPKTALQNPSVGSSAISSVMHAEQENHTQQQQQQHSQQQQQQQHAQPQQQQQQQPLQRFQNPSEQQQQLTHSTVMIAPSILNHYSLTQHSVSAAAVAPSVAVQSAISSAVANAQVKNNLLVSNGIGSKQPQQENVNRPVYSLICRNSQLQNETSLPGEVPQDFGTLNVENLQLLGLLNLQSSQQLPTVIPVPYHQQTPLAVQTLSSEAALPTPNLTLISTPHCPANGAGSVTDMVSSPPSTLPLVSLSGTSSVSSISSTIAPTYTSISSITDNTSPTHNTSLSPSQFVSPDISLPDPTVTTGSNSFLAMAKWKDVTFDAPLSNETSVQIPEAAVNPNGQLPPSDTTLSTPPPATVDTSRTRNFDDILPNSERFQPSHYSNQFPCVPTIEVSCINEDGNKPMIEAPTNSSTMVSEQSDVSSDLISVLSKQLSKYQVEDTVPLSLAVTPKGTGGGYGVGLNIDLDTLMAENLTEKTDSGKYEISPLSSSLLAHWMDVTANMDIQTLEEELELSMQSPMALSYSDLSLCSS
ncbi:mitogen-activated protein kinase 7-like [Octopus sinensis]|uniref:Mitogen-activated protein kinase n=1 Tax=Octopus sinensis TaxID=2607531 RepID=A0A6P7THN8_9MOLL|nr:mitogen-activated protein kinase 7-like [Octopus sinensis]XP_036369041.1 mitogen-activated protein kinase 7-like [Octopus sinensis]